ncbi:hypothetical protein PROFUN_02533 [Planoprotostelium fungivorum]|uniref:Uncharacterized protein n=1 Tax=Planoprotostelium fungivorum TaxID=1890364 RepID=A0A2P6MP92_9EUKA|nr:hypothetical protein PROFUN_02533 [Planoprotostelium fungivorum]
MRFLTQPIGFFKHSEGPTQQVHLSHSTMDNVLMQRFFKQRAQQDEGAAPLSDIVEPFLLSSALGAFLKEKGLKSSGISVSDRPTEDNGNIMDVRQSIQKIREHNRQLQKQKRGTTPVVSNTHSTPAKAKGRPVVHEPLSPMTAPPCSPTSQQNTQTQTPSRPESRRGSIEATKTLHTKTTTIQCPPAESMRTGQKRKAEVAVLSVNKSPKNRSLFDDLVEAALLG